MTQDSSSFLRLQVAWDAANTCKSWLAAITAISKSVLAVQLVTAHYGSGIDL